nr:GNAT family N-acetyltransferase [uncultured Sellimonas sp.]
MIRKTEKKDIQDVMEIIHMAQQKFRELGIDQWQDNYPTEEVILEDIEKEESYVLEEEGRIIATSVISTKEEITYRYIKEGQWKTKTNTESLIMHRLASHNAYKRKGAAGALLKFAEEMAEKEGKTSIRIDTHKDNKIMQNWLLKNGFEYCGYIYLVTGRMRYAYEKIL